MMICWLSFVFSFEFSLLKVHQIIRQITGDISSKTNISNTEC